MLAPVDSSISSYPDHASVFALSHRRDAQPVDQPGVYRPRLAGDRAGCGGGYASPVFLLPAWRWRRCSTWASWRCRGVARLDGAAPAAGLRQFVPEHRRHHRRDGHRQRRNGPGLAGPGADPALAGRRMAHLDNATAVFRFLLLGGPWRVWCRPPSASSACSSPACSAGRRCPSRGGTGLPATPSGCLTFTPLTLCFLLTNDPPGRPGGGAW